MKISFTTLSCPEWTWEQILEQAAALDYDGIEIRGIENEMYLPKAKPFLPENIEDTISVLKNKGLEIICLDTSCSFETGQAYAEVMKEGEDSIDLAEKLGVPYIRVFGDKIPDPAKKEETISKVASGLNELGRYAEDRNVYILIETHGDFSASDVLAAVFEQVDSKAVGILWDINNPFKEHGEDLKATYKKLGQYIKHTHIKDSKTTTGGEKLCLVGEGDLPLSEVVSILKEDGYTGWLSFEWEKKWHPEIEDPEIALPAYIKYVKIILQSV